MGYDYNKGQDNGPGGKQRSAKLLFTTEMINSLREDMQSGYQVDATPFFPYNTNLRAANITFKMTEDEMFEYEKCFNDAGYFIERYCKFLTDHGRRTVKLRDYQHEIVDTVTAQHYDPEYDEMIPDNRNVILLASRQVGKTTTTASYITWYVCFHSDRNVGIMANKQDTAIEIVSKVKDMIEGLPYFLQPGVQSWGQKGCAFDNGCKIISSATTKSASIGFTMNGILYLDEFAHIEASICDSFWRSVYPTLSASKTAQLIVSSTPNGMDNQYAKLWFGSQDHSNSFFGLRIDYWRVPGHDDKWAEQQKKDFGEEFFNQEFLLQFSSASSSLLRSSDFSFMERLTKNVTFVQKHIVKDSMFMDDPNLVWHPWFDPNSVTAQDRFVFALDTAEGAADMELMNKDGKKTPDYNALLIFKVVPNSIANMRRFKGTGPLTLKDAFRFIEVGRYMRNDQDETYLAQLSAEVALDLFGALEYDNVRMMVEMNFEGNSCLRSIMNHPMFFDELVVKTYHRMPVPGEKAPPKKYGFLTNSNKNNYCIKGKDLIGKRRIVITDKETFSQLKAFGWVHGKLKGVSQHDDLSYPAVNHVSRFLDEQSCIDWLEDWLFTEVSYDVRESINNILELYAPEDIGLSDEEYKMTIGYNEPMGMPQPQSTGSVFDSVNRTSPYSSRGGGLSGFGGMYSNSPDYGIGIPGFGGMFGNGGNWR